MKLFVLAILCILNFQNLAIADEIIPATSEDIDQFDRQLGEIKAMEGSRNKAEQSRSDRFEKLVAEEAKKIKNSESESRSEFGKWVSSQRAKTDQGKAGVSSNASKSEGSNASASARENNGNVKRNNGNGKKN